MILNINFHDIQQLPQCFDVTDNLQCCYSITALKLFNNSFDAKSQPHQYYLTILSLLFNNSVAVIW